MTYSLIQSHNFSGQTALIMGASRGIGFATAKILAAYGAHVVLAGRNLDTVQANAEEIKAQGHAAFAVRCDVADFESVELAISQTLIETGKLDVIVNTAGVIEPLAHLIDSDPKLWGLAADINYKGVYHGMRAAIPIMLERGGGIVINMSSGAANSSLPGWSHYCSNKAAAKKLTEVAHKELTGKPIRVVGLSPGTVATDMMAKIRDSKINVVSNLDWERHIPAEWVGEAVAFLCGPEGEEYAGTDFSIKTTEGRAAVGLPQEGAPDA